MFGIGAQELILIMVVALLVFGPKRLPELARSLGKGLAEFRRASSDLRHSLSSEPSTPSSPTIHPPAPAGPAQAIAPEGDPAEAPEQPAPVAAAGTAEDSTSKAPAETSRDSTPAASVEAAAEPGGEEPGPRGG